MFEKFMTLKSIKSYLYPMDDNGGAGGGGGGGTATMPEFEQQLTENLRGDERLTQFSGKTISDVVTSHFELGDKLTTLEGKQEGLVRIPGEESTDEERSAFYKALGRPEKSEEYVINRPEEMPPGMTYDETFEKDFRTTVHGLNLDQKQTSGMAKFFMEYELNRHNGLIADIKETREKATEALKKDWPGDYYEKNGAQAKRALLKFAEVAEIPEFEKWVNDSGFGDVPEVIRLFHATFGAIGDDFFVPGSHGGASDNELAPGEIRTFGSYDSMKKK